MPAKGPSQLSRSFDSMHIKKSEVDKSNDVVLVGRGPMTYTSTWTEDGDQLRKYWESDDDHFKQPEKPQEILPVASNDELYGNSQLEELSQSYDNHLLDQTCKLYDLNPLEEPSQPCVSYLLEETNFITDNELLSHTCRTGIFDVFGYGYILPSTFVPERPPESMEPESICIPTRETPNSYIPPLSILPPLPSPLPINPGQVQPMDVSDGTYSHSTQLGNTT